MKVVWLRAPFPDIYCRLKGMQIVVEPVAGLGGDHDSAARRFIMGASQPLLLR